MLLELIVLVLPEVTYTILVRRLIFSVGLVEHCRLDKLAWPCGS